MREYIDPQTALPDMQYTKPESKPKRCGLCTHGEVTNAGANIPGYHCQLMEQLFLEAGIDNGNTAVNPRFGCCRHYKHHRDAIAEAEAEKGLGAGI